MSKLIICVGLMLLACVALVSADEENNVHPDVQAGMRVERKTREECKYEFESKGCKACCRKFGLHKWNVRYNPGECKCHHLPQPPQLPENMDIGKHFDKFIPKVVSDEEAEMSIYRGFV